MEEQPVTTITYDEILRIMKLMEESDWDYVEIATKDCKFRAGKSPAQDSMPAKPYAFKPDALMEKEEPVPEKTELSKAKPSVEQQTGQTHIATNQKLNGSAIYAPMMGMFYRSPSPGAKPFVEVGDIITEHTIVAIIEVMKVMSSVEAGVRGKISSAVAENGQLVQYKQPLFLIELEGQPTERG